ncbi:signal peptide peptidase SppA [Candidatus Woesearchaeota archaeon]|nr:signal peptide peptidase SppA [Candidatus Woesearchaeota archaeon]
MTKVLKRPLKSKIFTTLKILAMLYIVSILISLFFSYSPDFENESGNIAIIPIQGAITTTGSSGFGTDISSSDSIMRSLDKADQNPNIKAIILEINSPGGSGVAADEIGQKIKSINKTTVAVIRDMGASAAYWIASASDHIVANRMSITGSIGVIGSYLDFSGLMNRYNVTYQRYVSGEFKDMGSPYKEPSEAERELYQQIIDKMKKFFVDEVAMNRNLSVEDVQKMANGQIFLGIEAKELGLVDELGTMQDAIVFVESELNITADVVEIKEKKSFTDLLEEFSSGLKIGKFINTAPLNFQII